MGGSIKLSSFKESSVVSFGTNYATGNVDATGLTVTISTSGNNVFVGLVGSGNSYVSTDCTLLKGSDPTFVVTSSVFNISYNALPNIVHTGGTVPSVVPFVLAGSSEVAFGGGGSGVGTDSTFYWQPGGGISGGGERTQISVRNLLTIGSSGEYGLDILRTTSAVTTTPFQYTRGFKTLNTDYFSPRQFYFIDNPVAGVHVYKVQLRSNVTTGKIDLGSVKLIAYEL